MNEVGTQSAQARNQLKLLKGREAVKECGGRSGSTRMRLVSPGTKVGPKGPSGSTRMRLVPLGTKGAEAAMQDADSFVSNLFAVYLLEKIQKCKRVSSSWRN